MLKFNILQTDGAMTKSLGMIITLTAMLAFVGGCQPENEQNDVVPRQDIVPNSQQPEPELQEPVPQEPEPEPQQLQTQQAEPEEIDSEQIAPEQIESLEPEPETQQAEPEEIDSEQTAPEQIELLEPNTPTSDEQDQQEAEDEWGLDSQISSERPAFYDACELIFKTYVDEQGLVDYKTLRRKRAQLIDAARKFDQVHPAQLMSWSDNEKISFWINAHNIFTLKLIIDNYPIEPRWYLINYPDSSIMQIVGGRDKTFFRIIGMEYTLREIEKEILMARFDNPKICFALSYASMGGAYLRNEPYYPDKLDRQLDEQVEKFLSSPRGLKIDRAGKIIFLSDIFNWYKKVFVANYGSIKKFRNREPHIQAYLNFIVDYVSPEKAGFFGLDNYKVEFQLYDWHLNEQP